MLLKAYTRSPAGHKGRPSLRDAPAIEHHAIGSPYTRRRNLATLTSLGIEDFALNPNLEDVVERRLRVGHVNAL